MANKIKAVIWDMGGVFLRSEDRSSREELAKEYALSYDQINELVFNSDSAQQATLGLIDSQVHWQNTGASLGISGDKLEDFSRRFFQGDAVDYELIDFIRSLKQRYTTGLLSNAWSDAREMLTKRRPCMDAFHISIFSCEVGLAKPNLEIYRTIIRLCGIEPIEAIFVDDYPENIEAANTLGIHGIRFLNRQQAIAEVNQLLGNNGRI